MSATAERSAWSSVVPRFFEGEVRADGGGEEWHFVSDNEVPGLVVFAVRAGERWRPATGWPGLRGRET